VVVVVQVGLLHGVGADSAALDGIEAGLKASLSKCSPQALG
jgi:hypothetical protein